MATDAGESVGEVVKVIPMLTTVMLPRTISIALSDDWQRRSGTEQCGSEGDRELLCLVTPAHRSVRQTMPAVLDLVQRLDIPTLDESAVESVVRLLGLVLRLVRASEAQRGAEGLGRIAEELLAICSGTSVDKPPVATSAEADLFDDEPSTPPLATSTVPPTPQLSLPTRFQQRCWWRTRRFGVTSRQVVDAIALKLIRFKTAVVRNGRGASRRKWELLEEGLVDHLVGAAVGRTAMRRGDCITGSPSFSNLKTSSLSTRHTRIFEPM